MVRRYDSSTRAAAMQRTREAILDAAVELFRDAWYDEVALGDIAKAAGVSQQTVANHFGTKAGLYLDGLRERFVPLIVAARESARAGDVASVVAAVAADYETTGDAVVRSMALAERVEVLQPVVEGGVAFHRDWVARMFAPQLEAVADRDVTLTLLAVALDAATWHRLRRGHGLSAKATAQHLQRLAEAVVAAG